MPTSVRSLSLREFTSLYSTNWTKKRGGSSKTRRAASNWGRTLSLPLSSTPLRGNWQWDLRRERYLCTASAKKISYRSITHRSAAIFFALTGQRSKAPVSWPREVNAPTSSLRKRRMRSRYFYCRETNCRRQGSCIRPSSAPKCAGWRGQEGTGRVSIGWRGAAPVRCLWWTFACSTVSANWHPAK